MVQSGFRSVRMVCKAVSWLPLMLINPRQAQEYRDSIRGQGSYSCTGLLSMTMSPKQGLG